MESLTIKKLLTFSFPEGFHVMSREELEKVYLDKNRNRAGIWDTDRHLIVSVFFNKPGALFYRLSYEKAAADGIRNLMKKKMPEYKEGRTIDTTLAGQKTSGFEYSYRVPGVLQQGSVRVFKYKKHVCTVYCYARAPVSAEDKNTLAEILSSMKTLYIHLQAPGSTADA